MEDLGLGEECENYSRQMAQKSDLNEVAHSQSLRPPIEGCVPGMPPEGGIDSGLHRKAAASNATPGDLLPKTVQGPDEERARAT